jgi:hypothetical protein
LPKIATETQGKGKPMKYALWTIAACHLAMAVEVYESDNGGYNVFFGNFGYHFAQGEN